MRKFLCLLCFIFLSGCEDRPDISAGQTVLIYLEALKSQDYIFAYDLLSQRSRRAISFRDFTNAQVTLGNAFSLSKTDYWLVNESVVDQRAEILIGSRGPDLGKALGNAAGKAFISLFSKKAVKDLPEDNAYVERTHLYRTVLENGFWRVELGGV